MPLPKLKHPTFTVTIPSLNKKVKMRPFTVKEEKILLLAKSDTSEAKLEVILDAIRQLLTNCILDETIDVDALTLFDFEYLFVKLRASSVDDTVEFMVKDEHDVQIPITIDLNQVELKGDTKSNVVDLGSGVFATLSHIKMRDLETIGKEVSSDDFGALVTLLKLTLVNVYDDEKVYTLGDDFDETELAGFVEQLSSKARNAIVAFYENAPRLTYTATYKNSKGEERSVTLTGLTDFFTS